MHIASGTLLLLLKMENISLFLWTRQKKLPRRRSYQWLPLTLLHIIYSIITPEASTADLAFSRHIHPAAVLRPVIGWAVRHTAAALLLWLKGTQTKRQSRLSESHPEAAHGRRLLYSFNVMLGPFHRSNKRLEIIEISLIVLSLLLILRYCKECEISVQPTCKTKDTVLQLHFTKSDKEHLIREKQT